MIDLWYLNTQNIGVEYLNVLLKELPSEMINDIFRFRDYKDRRLKVFGRLMVKKYYQDAKLEFNWDEWKVSFDGKPYYNMSKRFNISHSGEYVIVAFSDQEIGADIEELTGFDIISVLNYLHIYEAEYIKSALNQEDTFFLIWTRKEAYLKAIGKGIIDGVSGENCLQDVVMFHQEKWYLHSLSFIPNYKIALCTKIPNCKINIRELLAIEFKH